MNLPTKAAFAAVCLAGCMAFAPVEHRAVAVAYTDLSLARQADQVRLSDRMLSAMHDICGYRPNPKQIGQNQRFDACKASLTLAPHKADPAAMSRAFAKALSELG